MANWLRNATTDDEAARAVALGVVASTQTIVGFPPRLGAAEDAQAIALACGGIVFDGAAALLSDGTLAAGSRA
jgi:hypothetical protein